MTELAEVVCVGIDWSDVAKPQLRLARPNGREPSYLFPWSDGLRFRASANGPRYCCGWYDLSGEPRHVVCDTWEVVNSGRQCQRCRYREGFVSVHQVHRGEALPDNVRDYLKQPHQLYIDIFADGSSKVGTVAESRLESRLAEQGPVAALYVARARDGVAIRHVEAAVSSQARLPQTISTRRKLQALMSRVDIGGLARELAVVASHVRPVLDRLDNVELECFEPPRPWQLPDVSRRVFEATPVVEYPADLAEGDHSMFPRGLAGPIAVFSVSDDPDADLFAGNLSSLVGAPITFGDFRSSVAPVQPALF